MADLEQPVAAVPQHRHLHRDGAAVDPQEGDAQVAALRHRTEESAEDRRLTRVGGDGGEQQRQQRQQNDRDGLSALVLYAKAGNCRWAGVLAHFGETLEDGATRCGHCDSCARFEQLLAAEKSTPAAADTKPAPVATGAFAPGQRVRVRRFGWGEVQESGAEAVRIAFPRHGVREIMINVAYSHWKIENYFGNGHRWGAEIGYSFEGARYHGEIVAKPQGSAGGMRRIQDHSGFFDETTIVLCGDAIIDLDIGAALHERPARYNASKRDILAAESAGDALVFFPDNMQAESIERRTSRLRRNYAAGKEQFEREWPAWEEFLS